MKIMFKSNYDFPTPLREATLPPIKLIKLTTHLLLSIQKQIEQKMKEEYRVMQSPNHVVVDTLDEGSFFLND